MFIGAIIALVLLVAACMIFANGEGSFAAVAGIFLLLLSLTAGTAGMYYGPKYWVWQQGLSGQAELAKAQQNRKIKIEEAQAKLESAKFEAKAEVERARGVAEANKIVADSLGGPKGYLTWYYINSLTEAREQGAQVIYLPTEAGLPILEATRASKK